MNSWARTLVRGFVDVIFPPACVHCRGLVEVSAADESKARGTVVVNASETMGDANPRSLDTESLAEVTSADGGRARASNPGQASHPSACASDAIDAPLMRGDVTSHGASDTGVAAVRRPLRAAVRAPEFRHLCRRCAGQLEFVQPPHCTTCGHPFYGVVSGERTCVKCEGLEPVFGEGRTAVLFKGPARTLVIELKYHRALHVLADMAEVFRCSPHVLAAVRGGVLVPVPLHARKARERGYNQAALLASALAEAAGGGTRVESVLRRVTDTATQTAFDRRTRLANLKNAFALTKTAALNPALHYILVDDVFTTGSTLNSCARALREAGALTVDVVTFGHG